MTQADWEPTLRHRREVDALRETQRKRDGKIYDPILSAWLFADGHLESERENAQEGVA